MRTLPLLALALLAGCRAAPAAPSCGPAWDLVLAGGLVVDGTGAPARRADVAIAGGRIASIGDLRGQRALRTLDCAGLVVAPGFIDAHSHASRGLASDELSDALPLLRQGVTTVVLNPDGGGPVDLAAQREDLEEHGLGVNAALLVPFGSIRRAVVGRGDRAPSADELEEMRALARAGMAEGALGLSTGLFYAPQSFATTAEVAAVARAVAETGGVYHSHLRDESNYTIGVVASVEELIEICHASGLTGVVSHVKCLGPPTWGRSQEIVDAVEAARRAGTLVYADQYPYEASSTSLGAALLPRWAQAGGGGALTARLADVETRARIRDGVLENLARRGGAARIAFTGSGDASLAGLTLAALAAERGLAPADAALEVLASGGAGIVSFNMHEDDVRLLMAQPWTMTSSDGGLARAGQGRPHPRGCGAFARKLRRYVVEERVLTLEEAVRAATGLSAEALDLFGRGVLSPGTSADIAVFDLDAVRDRATYADPHLQAEGVVHVVVNGVLAVDHGRPTGARAGRVLRRRATP